MKNDIPPGKVYFVGLFLFQYIGKEKRELTEVRDRERHFLKQGDYVVANFTQANSFRYQSMNFEEKNINELGFASENKTILVSDDLTEEQELEIEKVFENAGFVISINKDTNNISNKDQVIALEEKNKISSWIEANLPNEIKSDEQISFDEKVIGLLERLKTVDTPEEYELPKSGNINNLTDDEVFKACEAVGIKVGRKSAETLKPILLPYLTD